MYTVCENVLYANQKMYLSYKALYQSKGYQKKPLTYICMKPLTLYLLHFRINLEGIMKMVISCSICSNLRGGYAKIYSSKILHNAYVRLKQNKFTISSERSTLMLCLHLALAHNQVLHLHFYLDDCFLQFLRFLGLCIIITTSNVFLEIQ